MIKFALKPEAGGDLVELTADSRDIYMWERSYKGKSFGALKSKLMMEDLYQLAYVTWRRQRGETVGTLGDFVDAYLLEFKQTGLGENGEDEPDPTQPAASDEL